MPRTISQILPKWQPLLNAVTPVCYPGIYVFRPILGTFLSMLASRREVVRNEQLGSYKGAPKRAENDPYHRQSRSALGKRPKGRTDLPRVLETGAGDRGQLQAKQSPRY